MILNFINGINISKCILQILTELGNYISFASLVMIFLFLAILIKQIFNDVVKKDYQVSNYLVHLSKIMLLIVLLAIINGIASYVLGDYKSQEFIIVRVHELIILINLIVVAYLAIILTSKLEKRRNDAVYK